jgi:hypothetical protein
MCHVPRAVRACLAAGAGARHGAMGPPPPSSSPRSATTTTWVGLGSWSWKQGAVALWTDSSEDANPVFGPAAGTGQAAELGPRSSGRGNPLLREHQIYRQDNIASDRPHIVNSNSCADP